MFLLSYLLPSEKLAFAADFQYNTLVRIFKNSWFSRFARKEGIDDRELQDLVKQLEAGQSYADLGGGVFKECLPRPNEGKSGGFRVIVLFRFAKHTFYVYGFAKSNTANISKKELAKLKKQAKTLFAMTDAQIQAAIKESIFEEIEGES